MKPRQSGSLPVNFGNPAIPTCWDPWLSVPRLLVVWLYRFLVFFDYFRSKYNASYFRFVTGLNLKRFLNRVFNSNIGNEKKRHLYYEFFPKGILISALITGEFQISGQNDTPEEQPS
jgi:hypothetical protein